MMRKEVTFLKSFSFVKYSRVTKLNCWNNYINYIKMPSISTDVSSLFLYLVVWDYSAQLLDHKSREDRTLMVWKINAYSLKDNDLKVIFLIFHELIPQLSSDITFLKDEIQQFLGNNLPRSLRFKNLIFNILCKTININFNSLKPWYWGS